MIEEAKNDCRQSRQWLNALATRPVKLPLFAHHAVTPEWKIERLVIPEHLIWFIQKNACAGILDGKRVILEAGTLMWLTPGVRFSFKLLQPSEPIELYRFRVTFPKPVPAPQRFLLLQKAWQLRPLMADIVQEMHTKFSYHEPRLRGLLLSLFSSIFHLRDQRETSARTLTSGQCKRLSEAIAQRAGALLSPAQLASVLKLSPDYFTRVFRATYGSPPREWIVRERVRLASQRLAESDISVTALAGEMGYPDVFAFSRQFKKMTGQSPRAFRRKSSASLRV